MFKGMINLMMRSLIASIRNPFIYLPNFAISLFFLFVYTAGIEAVAQLPELQNIQYLAFIFPVAVFSAAIGAASGAVEALVKDIESGYFSRLLLTPASRFSIIAAHCITGMLWLVFQTVLLLAIAMVMGLKIHNGITGIVLVILLMAGAGLGFTGYAATVALATKSSQAVGMATMIFFPLLFLSSTFVPLNLITQRWMRVAAFINPTTYILEGMRAIIIENWMTSYVVHGFIICLAIATVTISCATAYARRAVDS